MPLEEDQYFSCPYCAQENQLCVDFTAGSSQKFVVDCEVCCTPIIVRLRIRGTDEVSVEVDRENG